MKTEGCWFVLFKENREFPRDPDMGYWAAFWAPKSRCSRFILDENHLAKYQLIFLRTSLNPTYFADHLSTLSGMKRAWTTCFSMEPIDSQMARQFKQSLDQTTALAARLANRLPDQIVEILKPKVIF